MFRSIVTWVQILILAGGLLAAANSNAEEGYGQSANRPDYMLMAGDAVLARPWGVLATVIGAGLFVVTSPITAATGTMGEAGQALVIEPAATTFYRCLGCTEVGRRELPEAAD